MPISFKAGKPFNFSLHEHDSIPVKDRPYFVTRFISSGERLEFSDKIEEARKSNWKATDAILNEIAKTLVSGLINMDGETLDTLLPKLTNGQKWELIYGILNENEMTESEAKNSV